MKRSFFATFSVLFLLITILSGFSQAQHPQNSLAEYDGKTIFKGIAFGQGPVSDLFLDIWTEEQKQTNNSKESLKITGQILNEMETLDPEFFDEFEQGIKSGVHTTTYQVIVKGSELFQKAVESLNFNTLVPDNNAEGACLAMAAAAVGIVYVTGVYVLNAVVAANGIAIGNVVVAKNKTVKGSSVSGDIELEIVVNHIVESVIAIQ